MSTCPESRYQRTLAYENPFISQHWAIFINISAITLLLYSYNYFTSISVTFGHIYYLKYQSLQCRCTRHQKQCYLFKFFSNHGKKYRCAKIFGLICYNGNTENSDQTAHTARMCNLS